MADSAVDPADAEDAVRRLGDGLGADVGVHGAPATLHVEDLWISDVTISTGLVDTYSTRSCWRCWPNV
ncbi:MAG TPA: hypothetical protein VGN37_26900 [Actinocatenispora sp.]